MEIHRIPDAGITNPAALREAAAGEFSDIIRLVRQALASKLRPGIRDTWIDIESIFSDHVVVSEQARFMAYPYTLSEDNQVTLGDPSEVTRDFIPVRMVEANAFIEAKDDEGLKWRICVIKSGISKNKTFYPDSVLRESAPLFDGARVFVKSDDEHIRGKGKSFSQLIGRLSNIAFIEGKSTDSGQLQADLELLQSAGDVPVKLLEAYKRDMADLFGFSINAKGRAAARSGKRIAKSITKVNSVDLIIEPGAGGQIINLIEAVNPEVYADMSIRTRMIEAVKKANKGSLPEGLDTDNDDALEAAYIEAMNSHAANDKDEGGAGIGGVGSAAPAMTDEVREEIRMVEARSNMRVAIAGSALPDAAKAKLQKQFEGLDRFTEAQVEEAIAGERDYLAKFTESGRVQGLGGTHLEISEDRSEKVDKMLDSFFDSGDRSVQSFKECYIEITGDQRVTGHTKDVDQARLREALGEIGFVEALNSSSFSNVLGDAMARAMVRDYNVDNAQYDIWKMLADTVPVNDFRTQERTRFGGYGDLPAVAEEGAYNALTSPSDEAASYVVTKRGGIEKVTLEMIKNDDVGSIQRIPTRMSRAAKRTLAKFVLDFIRTNPVIYDTTALFTVGHGNLGSAALSATSLAARRLAMLKQTEAGSNEPLGIGPANLWVPPDLEETAVDIFRRNTENDKTLIQSLALNVIPVWYWTDTNDWAISADKMDIPTIEIGFLDGNEEPELFVQDNPTQGSLFTNDQITYKIRHIYGGTVKDYRGMDKSIVA
jgi:hypothetical protein